MSFFPVPYEKSAATAITAHLTLKSKSSHDSVEEGVLTIYCQVGNHPLESHAIDHIVAEKDSKFACFVNRRPCGDWNLGMGFDYRRLNVYRFMPSMSSRVSWSKDCCSPLDKVCDHTERATRLHLSM